MTNISDFYVKSAGDGIVGAIVISAIGEAERGNLEPLVFALSLVDPKIADALASAYNIEGWAS